MDWEQIWREHSLEIYNYIYYRVYNKQEAEDITQEAFFKLIRAEKRYEDRPVSSIVALLKTIARNLIVDNWRKQNNGANHVYIELDEYVPAEQPCIEKKVEQRDEVKRALDLLNQEQQKIIRYRLLDGFSIAETAQLMGKSVSAIKTTQYRSIQYLRRTLSEREAIEIKKEKAYELSATSRATVRNGGINARREQAV